MKSAFESLKKYWGYDAFLEGQEEAIQSIFDNKDTLVLLPTGGGKSLCYQVPATVFGGMALVISPLISLMQDQVQQLHERGISATYINSSLSSREIEQRIINARNGMYDLFYCAPERLQTPSWQAELTELPIDLVAVDEAHCISEWGHDFRPTYRKIRSSLEDLNASVRWLALTATATPKVRKDILENLEFSEPAVISRGFERPNLKWWVVKGADKRKSLLKTVERAVQQGSGIVYGGTRKNCERLAALIHQTLNIHAEAYHAGMDGAGRKEVQEKWFQGEVPLVVATTAFGMGIDKADCRFVIHYQMAKSLEAYYQQAGRAGRDGEESYPILLFKEADARRAVKQVKESCPDFNQLQKVYDGVCDILELAVGAQMDEMKEISFDDLKKRTRLPKSIIRSSLKVLKRKEVLEIASRVSPQTGILFTVNQDYLLQLIEEEENSRKAAFLDILYRQFGGKAFQKIKYLDTGYIQQKLQIGNKALKQGLRILQNHDRILQYKLLGELPMVRPLEARVKTLSISRNELEAYRNSLLQKLNFMKGYIETDECREKYIRRYFGEKGVGNCGHCDNCLAGKDQADSLPTTDDIEAMKDVLEGKGKKLSEIKENLKWKSEKIEKSLTYLMRENKVQEESEEFRWED